LTNISEIVADFIDAFELLANILQLATLQFPLEEARSYMHSTCLNALKSASKSNKFGFKNTAKFMLDLPAVKNEINWPLKLLTAQALIKLQTTHVLLVSNTSDCKLLNGCWAMILHLVKMIIYGYFQLASLVKLNLNSKVYCLNALFHMKLFHI
jgi:hypothetical protein